MRKPKYDRSKVIIQATRFTFVGIPFKVAMKEAWKEEKLRVLKAMLRSGVVQFTFKTAAQQLRKAKGTTCKKKIPNIPPPLDVKTLFNFYDVKKQGWRKFEKNSELITIG